MRPRTLYVGKPHTNPVITGEAYTMNCPVETNTVIIHIFLYFRNKITMGEGFPGAQAVRAGPTAVVNSRGNQQRAEQRW